MKNLYESYASLFNLVKTIAYKEGNFTLASGKQSNFYIDCKQIMFRPDAMWHYARLFHGLLQVHEDCSAPWQACGGMALGAVPLCTALSMEMYAKGRYFPTTVARKTEKNHGTAASLEGNKTLPPAAKILLIEDTVTTGGSTLRAANAFRQANFVVDQVFSLMDRQASGAEHLKADGLMLTSLYTLEMIHSGEKLCEKKFQQLGLHQL